MTELINNNDRFLSIIEKINYSDLFTLCNTSKTIKKKCNELKSYITTIFLYKMYNNEDNKLQQLIIINNIHNNNEKYNINKILQSLNVKLENDVNNIFDYHLYINKKLDIYVQIKTNIIPLPKKFYNIEIDKNLYDGNNYINHKTTLENLVKNLWINNNNNENNVLEISANGYEFKIFNELYELNESILDNFKKDSDIYNLVKIKNKHFNNLSKYF